MFTLIINCELIYYCKASGVKAFYLPELAHELSNPEALLNLDIIDSIIVERTARLSRKEVFEYP